MQVQRKTAAFLLPGMLLFFGLTLLLFFQPAQYPIIALLFFTFVLMTAVLISLEMASVFGVLVTMIELGGVAVVQGAAQRGSVACSAVSADNNAPQRMVDGGVEADLVARVERIAHQLQAPLARPPRRLRRL